MSAEMGGRLAVGPATASERRALLWTDDLLAAQLIQNENELSSDRVWSQAVLAWAAAHGFVDRRSFSSRTASLLRCGYCFVGFTPFTLVDVCEQELWNLRSPSVQAVLREFGGGSWQPATALEIVSATIRDIWCRVDSAIDARRLTMDLLANLNGLKEGRQIIELVLGNVDRLLGLAAVREPDLRDLLKSHLAQKRVVR